MKIRTRLIQFLSWLQLKLAESHPTKEMLFEWHLKSLGATWPDNGLQVFQEDPDFKTKVTELCKNVDNDTLIHALIHDPDDAEVDPHCGQLVSNFRLFCALDTALHKLDPTWAVKPILIANNDRDFIALLTDRTAVLRRYTKNFTSEYVNWQCLREKSPDVFRMDTKNPGQWITTLAHFASLEYAGRLKASTSVLTSSDATH